MVFITSFSKFKFSNPRGKVFKGLLHICNSLNDLTFPIPDGSVVNIVSLNRSILRWFMFSQKPFGSYNKNRRSIHTVEIGTFSIIITVKLLQTAISIGNQNIGKCDIFSFVIFLHPSK